MSGEKKHVSEQMIQIIQQGLDDSERFRKVRELKLSFEYGSEGEDSWRAFNDECDILVRGATPEEAIDRAVQAMEDLKS